MSGVVVVRGERDSDRTKALLRRNQEPPTLVVVPAPQSRQARESELASAILAAIGRTVEVRFNGHRARSVLVHGWLVAGGVTDVMILDANLLTAGQNDRLCELSDVTGIRVWFVGYGRWLGDEAFLARATSEMTMPEFERRWLSDGNKPVRAAVDVPPESHLPGSFPPVPSCHAAMFRTRCRALLHPSDFVVVEGVYRDGCREAHATLEGTSRQGHAPRLARAVRRAFNQYADPDAVVAALRGLQAGAFHHGWNLAIDEVVVRAAAARIPRAATRTDEDWNQLAVHTRTDVCALLALLASDLDITTIAKLVVSNVAADGSTVTVIADGEPLTVEVDDRGRPAVHAQHIVRTLESAQPGEPFFFSTANFRGMAPTRRLARETSEMTGFPVGNLFDRRNGDITNIVAWSRDIGVTITGVIRRNGAPPTPKRKKVTK